MAEINENTKIISLKNLAEDYVLLDLLKPEGFQHQAGQYTKLFFPDMPEKPIYLSIASAPKHQHVQLCIATRNPDIHRRYQDAYQQQTRLHLAKPEGKFLLPGDRGQHYVFVAGGSGVSPVRSMCLDVIYEAKSVTFLLGGARKEILPYFEEFTQLAGDYENFQFWPCVDTISEGVFLGNTVELFLDRFAELPSEACYFLCGPMPMMEAFTAAALAQGVAADRIFFERY